MGVLNPPLHISEECVGSLNFHPYPAVMSHPSSSELEWSQRRPSGESGLSPLSTGNEATLLSGFSEGHVKSNNGAPLSLTA